MSNLIKEIDGKHVEYGGHIYRLHGKYFVRGVKKGDKYTYEYLHRAVYQDNFGEIPKGFVVHHKDENTKNNIPENLMLLSNEGHTAHHKRGVPLTEEHKSKITGRPKGSKNSMVHRKNGWPFPPSF